MQHFSSGDCWFETESMNPYQSIQSFTYAIALVFRAAAYVITMAHECGDVVQLHLTEKGNKYSGHSQIQVEISQRNSLSKLYCYPLSNYLRTRRFATLFQYIITSILQITTVFPQNKLNKLMQIFCLNVKHPTGLVPAINVVS